jgi:hypothetical protein
MTSYFAADDLNSLRTARDTILKARAEGTRRIVYEANGVRREIEWRSDVELRQALGDIEQRIAALEGKPALNVVNIRSEKGWA